mgnify:CR=1 FL=1
MYRFYGGVNPHTHKKWSSYNCTLDSLGYDGNAITRANCNLQLGVDGSVRCNLDKNGVCKKRQNASRKRAIKNWRSHSLADIVVAEEDIAVAEEDIAAAQEDIAAALAQEDIAAAQEDIAAAQEDIAVAQEDIAVAQEDIADAQEVIDQLALCNNMNVLLYPGRGDIKNVTDSDFVRLYSGFIVLNDFKRMLKLQCDLDDDTDQIDSARNFVEAIIKFTEVSGYDTSEFNLIPDSYYNIKVKNDLFGHETSRIFPWMR